MIGVDIAHDGKAWQVTSAGQLWHLAWHPPPDPPGGTPHGSAAVCLIAGQVVLISTDGQHWGLPGGRPEQGEGRLPEHPVESGFAPLYRRIFAEAGISVGE
jgi:hypothetical protein